MANSTVNVSNIAAATGDSEIRDFFSFCGKISDINVTPEGETKKAEVTFEKETAMKTALLLNNTQLGTNHISVTSASGDNDDDGSHFAASSKNNGDRDTDEITQEEKPRARILAEYLSQGYVVGDAAIERAISLDSQHGVSSRFLNTLHSLDAKYHASDRAKATDDTYGISQQISNLLGSLSSYFVKASNTPTGKKVVEFYTEGQRQVTDVHAEARRLADLKKEEHGGSAYKAAGLEKVFGKEPEGQAGASSSSGSAEKPAGEAGATDAPVNEKHG